ncbi:copper homeostasis membrane protein CopD [Pantoea sp. 1.19]|uniref:copper homeostasis membrane protein CopD n=1 Tax=Pantoea sp. 1.19 TaxID=1925589 RepID=UPI000948B3BC|nr:copper homeostasis membrane protein CopD [Pantoea sp. 1.19]
MTLALLYILLRWLHFAALMLLAGATGYAVLLAPRRYRPWLAARCRRHWQAGTLLTLFSALAILAVQTGLMGDGASDMSRPAVWLAVLGTAFGQAWLWQLVLASAAAVALCLRGEQRQRLLLLLAIGQLAGLAWVGHAAMHDGVLGAVQRLNQTLHLLSAAFWGGGLLVLPVVLADARRITTRADAIRSLIGWSRIGHLAVAAVILSGAVNAVLIRGWPWSTVGPWTQLLLVKATLVALMVLLALVNRYWLVPRFTRPGAARQFMRLTGIEAGLALVVTGLVSGFATLQPM